MAILIASHSGTAIGTSGNAADLASNCPTPTSTAPAAATPTTGSASSAPTAAATPVPAATGTAAPAAAAAAPAAAAATSPAGAAAQTPAAAGTPPGAATPMPATTPTAVATPSASASATATATPSASATATPSATATATPTSTASATPCPSATPSATPTTPTTVANVSCDIIVPARPLTAQGLATPYQLTGTDGASPAASGCNMANAANLGAFVQATILDPTTGKLSVYEPLVITQGTTPAAAPVVPTLPAGAIVTIDFGFNGTNLTQVGATARALRQGRCVDGLNGSIFGQVSFCNGTAFFRAARRAEADGRLVVPSPGTSPKTGQPCPTTRSFSVVDQDPSDNVTTDYLLTASGQTAQFNAANQGALPGATDIVNGSDNKLLTAFLDPAFGCTPFEAPDLSQAGSPGSSQALNELSAAASNVSPAALVPENDEMVVVNDAMSAAKTNLYRSEIGQPAISAATNQSDSPAGFCQNMVNIQTPFLSAGQALLATGSSPVPAVGNNLLTFLANRLSMSFANLGCQTYGLTDPVTVTVDGNGVATGATFSTAQQTAADPGATPTSTSTSTPTPTPAPTTRPRRHHPRRQNPSGM